MGLHSLSWIYSLLMSHKWSLFIFITSNFFATSHKKQIASYVVIFFIFKFLTSSGNIRSIEMIHFATDIITWNVYECVLNSKLSWTGPRNLLQNLISTKWKMLLFKNNRAVSNSFNSYVGWAGVFWCDILHIPWSCFPDICSGEKDIPAWPPCCNFLIEVIRPVLIL